MTRAIIRAWTRRIDYLKQFVSRLVRRYDLIVGGSLSLSFLAPGYNLIKDVDLVGRKCPGKKVGENELQGIKMVVKRIHDIVYCVEGEENYEIISRRAVEIDGVLVQDPNTILAHKIIKIGASKITSWRDSLVIKFELPKNIADAIFVIRMLNPDPREVAKIINEYKAREYAIRSMYMTGDIDFEYGLTLSEYLTGPPIILNHKMFYDFMHRLGREL